jgi:hypothetical protein
MSHRVKEPARDCVSAHGHHVAVHHNDHRHGS